MTPVPAAVGTDREQLPALTSLRFVAAFWVLGHHAMPRVPEFTKWNALWDAGWLGVTFFFVLSGFILTYTYSHDGRPIARRAFWMARVARVAPVYYAAMIFAIPQFWHSATHAPAGTVPPDAATIAGAAVTSVAMMQAWFSDYVCIWNCPSWSISAEFFFYALFPWVVPFGTTRRGRTGLGVVTVLALALVIAGFSKLTVSPVALAIAGAPLNPLARLPEFLAGVWLGSAFLDRRRRTLATPGAQSWVGLGVAVGGAAGIAIAGRSVFGGAMHIWALPFFSLAVYAAATLGPTRTGVLGFAPLVLFGNASYVLYMSHGPLHGYVLALVNRVAPGTPAGVVFVAYLAGAIALALTGYFALERPARAWIRRRAAV